MREPSEFKGSQLEAELLKAREDEGIEGDNNAEGGLARATEIIEDNFAMPKDKIMEELKSLYKELSDEHDNSGICGVAAAMEVFEKYAR